MISPCSIYLNTRITPGYYYAKVVQIETEDIDGASRPRIGVVLKLGSGYPNHGAGKELASIIYETDKAVFYHENFCNAYFIKGDRDYQMALNRWACVEVFDAEYKEAKYSAVKYIYQRRSARINAVKIEQSEREGKFSWQDGSEPSNGSASGTESTSSTPL